MPSRDIVVIGGSAGALEAIGQVLSPITSAFPVAIFVVLHTSPAGNSNLARVFSRRTALRVSEAIDGEPITRGRVYLARPDHHLLLEGERVRVTRGPRENRNRPAIDPLFRSAALSHGRRVIGVVLSGMLDDGTAGLWSVKDRGGIAIVQDPADASFAMMPENAIAHVAVDHICDAATIGKTIMSLAREPLEEGDRPVRKMLETETAIALEANALHAGSMDLGELSPYSCPECHGVLSQIREADIMRFRCHTGHAYSANSLLASLTESVGEVLWSAVRGLEESVMLLRHSAKHMEGTNPDAVTNALREAANAGQRLEILRKLALSHEITAGPAPEGNESEELQGRVAGG